MKIYKQVTLLLLIIFFSSCSNNNSVKDEKAVFSKTFPFSSAEKIELISYPDRIPWDTLENGEPRMFDPIIKNGKLRIDTTKILQKVKLDNTQSKQLFEILYNYKCKDTMVAACYEPRHAFIFSNKKQSLFAAIEFCFECLRAEKTKGTKDFSFCFDKIDELKKFTESVGVKSEVREETATNSR